MRARAGLKRMAMRCVDGRRAELDVRDVCAAWTALVQAMRDVLAQENQAVRMRRLYCLHCQCLPSSIVFAGTG